MYISNIYDKRDINEEVDDNVENSVLHLNPPTSHSEAEAMLS